MIALIQRVTEAGVRVQQQLIGQIGPGILALIGVVPEDTESSAERLLQRLLDYRIFADAQDRMNRSLRDVDGGLLLVPQFTLAAQTDRGTRPGFSTAAPPQQAQALFDFLLQRAHSLHTRVQSGRFGADMQVALVNDGPVTFWLEAR